MQIETNEQGNVTKFFGFYVTDKVENKKNFVKLNESSLALSLYIRGKEVAQIDWFNHFWGKDITDNEIWAYLLNECRQYTQGKIYVDRFFAEESYQPLALSVSSKHFDNVEKELEAAQEDCFFHDLDIEE